MTPGQLRYQAFLQTDFWKALSSQCIHRDGGKCRKCESTNRLQAHHIFYRDDWTATKLDDLATLCNGCHEQCHGLRPVATKKRRSRLSKADRKKLKAIRHQTKAIKAAHNLAPPRRSAWLTSFIQDVNGPRL